VKNRVSSAGAANAVKSSVSSAGAANGAC
jgi:hypothetical protein